MASPPPLTLLGLPVEILCDVCRFAGVLPLVYLCSHLRDIIYSSKSFWSSIILNDSNRRESEALAFLRRRLERSGLLPLDIIFVFKSSKILKKKDKDLLKQISSHNSRIRTIYVYGQEMEVLAEVLKGVLLSPRLPETNFISKIHLRTSFNMFNTNTLHNLLRPLQSLFPCLTTLILPSYSPFIPSPDSPISTLKTLVFDGSSYQLHECPLYHILKFLAQTPNLELLWCKQSITLSYENTYVNLSDTDVLDTSDSPSGSVKVPVHLAKLAKVAVTVPGLGLEMLRAIDAPMLNDLHMDGTRDLPHEEEGWLEWCPARIHETLKIVASRSSQLRRLAFLGAYLPRNGWEWLLGCVEGHDVPFRMLESLSLREMEEINCEVTNAFNDSFLETYAEKGRVHLRRFAYLNSEPPISGMVLHQFITSIARRQAEDAELFELEIDRRFSEETKTRLQYLLSMGVKAIHHEEPVQTPNWWTLGKGIDPTESDSY